MTLRAIGVSIAVIVLAMTATFYAGTRSGKRELRLEQNTEALAMNATVVHADSVTSASAAAETKVAVKASIAAHVDLAPVRASVKVVSDSQISIDSGAPVLVAPRVIQLIGLQDRVQSADSSTKAKLIAENVALRIERDHLKERVALLEQQVDLVEPPRFGFKTGVVAGAAAVITVVVVAVVTLGSVGR